MNNGCVFRHHHIFVCGIYIVLLGTLSLGIFYSIVVKEQQAHVDGKFLHTFEHSCNGDDCDGAIKTQNRPGHLKFESDKHNTTKHLADFQYKFSPKQLKISVISNTTLINRSYFDSNQTVLNSLPKRIDFHNPELCLLDNGKAPYLLVLVTTVLNRVDERQTIRDTWGSIAYNDGHWPNVKLEHPVRILFILGIHNFSDKEMEMAKKEAEEHGDILLSDFIDSYQNLFLKVAVGLAWSDMYCHGVRHVIKIDADTFLFVPKLLGLLQKTDLQYKRFVMGKHNVISKVNRKGKWGVNKTIYRYDAFPPYFFGSSYVVSGQAVKALLSAYLTMPVVPIEDVFFTGILAGVTKTLRLDHSSFANPARDEVECDIVKGHFVSMTALCKTHFHAIFTAIQNQACNTYTMSNLYAPGCKRSPKPPF